MSAHNTLHGLLFQATSAEYIALCLQAYQLARHALLTRLGTGTFRHPAVIFDLDETVLDNSAFQAWQLAAGTNYDDSTWNEWCNAAEAEAVPGALEFIRYVRDRGARPFFVTSRSNGVREATLKNLAALGVLSSAEFDDELAWMADADPAVVAQNTRLFMKGMSAVKTPSPSGGKEWALQNKFDQRTWIAGGRGYEIILSVGDNLADYAEYYGQVKGQPATLADRRAAVLQDAALFGRDFILIPNATYGGWLRAFEGNQLGAADELARTPAPVRQGLVEPTGPFTYANPKAATPGAAAELSEPVSLGPKFDEKWVRRWAKK